MGKLRRHIAILLIAVLTLTGHSMAVARGMPSASGYMELCTGTGPVMVPVDAEGQPTGAPHICPDYSLMLMQALLATPVLPTPRRAYHDAPLVLSHPNVTERPRCVATARGPPCLS